MITFLGYLSFVLSHSACVCSMVGASMSEHEQIWYDIPKQWFMLNHVQN
jgi:hypothetical protein